MDCLFPKWVPYLLAFYLVRWRLRFAHGQDLRTMRLRLRYASLNVLLPVTRKKVEVFKTQIKSIIANPTLNNWDYLLLANCCVWEKPVAYYIQCNFQFKNTRQYVLEYETRNFYPNLVLTPTTSPSYHIPLFKQKTYGSSTSKSSAGIPSLFLSSINSFLCRVAWLDLWTSTKAENTTYPFN